MPANKKYLTTSVTQKVLKISAGFLGGYLVAITFHLALASIFNQVTIIITSTFTSFILWAVLMILAFLAKNGWKIWGIYIAVSICFYGITYFLNHS